MRPVASNDLVYFYRLYRDPEVMKYFAYSVPSRISEIRTRVKSLAQRWEEKKFSWFVVFSKSTGSFIGACGLGVRENGKSEFAYLIKSEHWGKGHATEMVNALVRKNKITVLNIQIRLHMHLHQIRY